jgi:hypothetical protein
MSKPELHKSKTKNEFRIRFLRKKEDDRWDWHGLERSKDTKAAYDYIYTLEQAIALGISFRKDWRNEKKDAEKYYFSDVSDSYGQQNDWVVTEKEFDGTLWVMRVLWRNEYPGFPHIKTATGTYPYKGKKVFDGSDQETQYRASTDKAYSNPEIKLSEREQMLVYFIVKLIGEYGYYSKDIVKLAYNSAYKNNPSWQKVVLIMKSAKIMGEVAKELKKHLADAKIDPKWVFEQLKSMGETDHDKDPNRRLEVVKLVGAMMDIPTYMDKEVEHRFSNNGQSPLQLQAEDLQAAEDIKVLGD